MTKLAPIVIFAFNRPDHLEKTLSALSECAEAAESPVFVFADGARSALDVPSVDRVRRVLSEYACHHRFQRFDVTYSSTNRGLATSVIAGVSQVLNVHNRVIVLEDDIKVSPTFLTSMNRGLAELEAADEIWSLSGYTPPIDIPETYLHQSFLTGRASSWGWGTWKSRWDKIDWSKDHYAELARSREFRRRFAKGGLDLPITLDEYISGVADSWAVRWCATQCQLDTKTVFPVQSLVQNLGMDGTGIHGPVSEKYKTEASSQFIDYTDFPAYPNRQIDFLVARFYMSRYRFLRRQVRSHIAHLMKGRQ